ncbi:MAG: PAS domain-containing protein [Spirochaetales bacterium]|nr:PAS domain-containing protein [Spirochaetales bacterium]
MKEAFFQSAGKNLCWISILQTIVERDKDSALAILDKNLVFLYATDKYYKDPDLKDKPIIGQCLYDVYPNSTREWRALNRRALNGENFRSDDDILIRSDGTIQHMRWMCFPWYDAGGEVGGLVLYSTFIDDPAQDRETRVQREECLREEEKERARREKLQSAWKMKTRGYPDDAIADILSLRGEDVAAL